MGHRDLPTSANVIVLLPPKNGPALLNNGSISFLTASSIFPASSSFSLPSAINIWYIEELTLLMNVSTKKLILALVNALVGLS